MRIMAAATLHERLQYPTIKCRVAAGIQQHVHLLALRSSAERRIHPPIRLGVDQPFGSRREIRITKRSRVRANSIRVADKITTACVLNADRVIVRQVCAQYRYGRTCHRSDAQCGSSHATTRRVNQYISRLGSIVATQTGQRNRSDLGLCTVKRGRIECRISRIRSRIGKRLVPQWNTRGARTCGCAVRCMTKHTHLICASGIRGKVVCTSDNLRVCGNICQQKCGAKGYSR